MTAFGGYFIGGEIHRSALCPQYSGERNPRFPKEKRRARQ